MMGNNSDLKVPALCADVLVGLALARELVAEAEGDIRAMQSDQEDWHGRVEAYRSALHGIDRATQQLEGAKLKLKSQ